MLTIGWDLHTCTSTLSIFESEGQERKSVTLRGRPEVALRYLRGLGEPFQIAFEASTGYGWVHDELAGLAARVVVAHPGKVAAIYRNKRKNDRTDARMLAQLLRVEALPAVWVPPAATRRWRGLIEHRGRLVRKRSCAKTQLRALLRTHMVASPRSLWSKAGMSWLREVSLPGGSEELQRDQLLMEVDHYQAMIRRVEEELDAIASGCAGVGLLMSIPGVGPRTAEAVAAYIGDPHRFRSVKRVGAYFGLVPCQDESAGKARLGHITKDGPSSVRWLLVEATWQAIRRSPRLRQYFERIRRGMVNRRRIALVATAHYLLRIMLQMLKSGECWRAEGVTTEAAA